ICPVTSEVVYIGGYPVEFTAAWCYDTLADISSWAVKNQTGASGIYANVMERTGSPGHYVYQERYYWGTVTGTSWHAAPSAEPGPSSQALFRYSFQRAGHTGTAWGWFAPCEGNGNCFTHLNG